MGLKLTFTNLSNQFGLRVRNAFRAAYFYIFGTNCTAFCLALFERSTACGLGYVRSHDAEPLSGRRLSCVGDTSGNKGLGGRVRQCLRMLASGFLQACCSAFAGNWGQVFLLLADAWSSPPFSSSP